MIIDFDSKNKGGGGKEPVVEALNVTANGSYTAPSGVDGYNPVNVNVPQREPVLESLSVTDNGTYTPSAGKDGFDSVDVNVPKEHHNVTSKSITANGTYNSEGNDVWNSVDVNVPERQPVLESLSVTDNGTYTPEIGVDGYNSVSVNVPKEHHNVTSKSITANGTYNSDGDEVWNSVDVNVPERQPVLESLSVNANGTYNAPSNIDGYNTVSVNVPQKTFNKASVTKEYTANGQYSIATPDGYDGISDVNLTVNVPSREPVLESLSVTDNGTYTPSSGVDGYNSVEVNVPKSGGFDTKLLKDLSITQYDENMNQIRSIDVSGNDFSNVQSLQSFAAWNDSLKTVNMSNCIFTSKLSDTNYMFQGCTSLETIDFTNCDFSNSGKYSSSFSSAFNSSKLTTIISDGLKLPDSQMDNTGLYEAPLTVDSIVGLLNALPTTTNGYSFQIGQTNIDKLSEEQKSIATGKGWTLI